MADRSFTTLNTTYFLGETTPMKPQEKRQEIEDYITNHPKINEYNRVNRNVFEIVAQHLTREEKQEIMDELTPETWLDEVGDIYVKIDQRNYEEEVIKSL